MKPNRPAGNRSPTRCATRRPRPATARARLSRIATCLCLAAACTPSESAGLAALALVDEGVLNDPGNKSLRFDLLRYGLAKFCREMQRRGAPIRIEPSQPITGRFFADGCRAQIVDQPGRQGVIVSYQGVGYGWTAMTGRLGFTTAGTAQYAVDFQMHDARLYVYFRPLQVSATSFQPRLVESAIARVGIALSGVDAAGVGQRMVSDQLQRGFTVVRHSTRGETEMSMGILAVGERPQRPFHVDEAAWAALANESTEIAPNQQDFVGGVHLDRPGPLRLTARLAGPAAVDLLLVPALAGRALVEQYTSAQGPVALKAPPLAQWTVRRGQPLAAVVPLGAGDYFLILDNSPAVGRAAPALGEFSAKIDYLLQLSSAD